MLNNSVFKSEVMTEYLRFYEERPTYGIEGRSTVLYACQSSTGEWATRPLLGAEEQLNARKIVKCNSNTLDTCDELNRTNIEICSSLKYYPTL